MNLATRDFRHNLGPRCRCGGEVIALPGPSGSGKSTFLTAVAVARALANRPSIILADEPTAALDSHRGRQVIELFAQVAHEHGAGVIVVTHDHRALDVVDTIYEWKTA